MKIYIDCEWNDYQGDLISMALVSEYGDIFYESLGCKNPSEWIAKNVMPKIDRDPIELRLFQNKLMTYLGKYKEVQIVADWPEDIMHFCKVLIVESGFKIKTPPLSFLVVEVDTVSSNPHNALADAIALRAALES